MKPFEIARQNNNLELFAKITDSMVQDFGCRVKYDKTTGCVDLIGEDYCQDVVVDVVGELLKGRYNILD